jgi:hypothetical protein
MHSSHTDSPSARVLARRPVVASENSLCTAENICGDAALTRRELLPFSGRRGQPGKPQMAHLCLAFVMEPQSIATPISCLVPTHQMALPLQEATAV